MVTAVITLYNSGDTALTGHVCIGDALKGEVRSSNLRMPYACIMQSSQLLFKKNFRKSTRLEIKPTLYHQRYQLLEQALNQLLSARRVLTQMYGVGGRGRDVPPPL